MAGVNVLRQLLNHRRSFTRLPRFPISRLPDSPITRLPNTRLPNFPITRFVKRSLPVAALLVATGGGAVRSAGPTGEWRNYAADKASTRYTALDQINAGNVRNLRVVWRQSATPAEVKVGRSNVPPPSGNYQHTPLMAGGLVYMSSGIGVVVALDPATGKVVWVEDPPATQPGAATEAPGRGRGGADGAPGASRGLAYWSDDRDARILTVSGSYLIALNARTGKRYPDFG